jgi:transcription initiation factor TFIID TATA-box-binding protein
MPPKKKAKKKAVDFDKLVDETSTETELNIPPYRLVNVVSTFSLGKSLNLKRIALQFKFLEFNPQNFAAATLRIKSPRTTALVFASGNMVCTGAGSEIESRLAARKYVHILQKVGILVSFNSFKIQNIVAAAAVGFTIRLQDIADAYGPYTSYEPELFPGLIFRSISPKLVFLIFRSGKIVITGAKHKDEIKSTYESLYRKIILKYRDEEGSTSSSSQYWSETRRQRIMKGVGY